MARIGKIARLPLETREKLNRRLADGETGGSLLRWLNGLPEGREVLEELFGGAAITKQNLSEWRKGGFREWQTRQELFSDPKKVAARAHEIREVAGDKLTDDLATVLAGHYAVVLKRWLAQPTQELEARLRVLHGLCVDIVALRRGDHAVARLKFDMERWEFESNLVQVKNFHRGGAETRRECEGGEDATERVAVSGDGGRGESKLVQPKIFSGAVGSGVRTTAEAGEGSRLAGLLSNIYMFSKAGVSFSVSPGLGWSVGTAGRRTVERAVGHAGREAVKTANFRARHPLTWLKPGVNGQREEFCRPPAPTGECPPSGTEISAVGTFRAPFMTHPLGLREIAKRAEARLETRKEPWGVSKFLRPGRAHPRDRPSSAAEISGVGALRKFVWFLPRTALRCQIAQYGLLTG